MKQKKKLAAFCHVSPDAVMSTHDVPNIYHVPLMLEKQGLCKILGIDCNSIQYVGGMARNGI